MTTSAPRTRLVDALTGEKASPVMGIIASAEHIRQGLDDASRLREENARLRRNVAMLTRQLDALMDTDKGELQCRIDELVVERDNLASDLVDARETHRHMLTELSRTRNERDNYRAAVAR
jgi:hypothetical protein